MKLSIIIKDHQYTDNPVTDATLEKWYHEAITLERKVAKLESTLWSVTQIIEKNLPQKIRGETLADIVRGRTED